MPDGETLSLGEQLEIFADQELADAAQMLERPDFPALLGEAWYLFEQVQTQRGGGFGPDPLGYQEILAWSQMMRLTVRPWHLRGICAIDLAFRSMAATDTAKINIKQLGEDPSCTSPSSA